MKLYKGITGFYEQQNETPEVDGRHFKYLCFSLIHANGGSVLKFNEPQESNFFKVEVNAINKHIYILLNAHNPLLAFASIVQFDQIKFIDDSLLYDLFRPYYQILNTEELNKPLSQFENELYSDKLKQVAFWKPNRIGDIIFNHWD